jgi:TRAP-type C4-dicarboxylate transport system substrate-binding protein
MRRVAGAIAIAALLLLCGCTEAGTKAGAGRVPLTLRLATVEQQANAPYAPDVEAFVAAVERRSAGAVKIDVDWMQPGWVSDAETRAGRSVRDGGVDLALIPSRAFSELGVDRLNALQAPFLIDSAELASSVVMSPIGGAMLEDLAADGFVGLGMAYESLRHPVAYEAPLIEREDYAGIGVRTPESTVARRMFEELGARPEVSWDYLRDQEGNRLGAAEGAFAWWASLPADSIITANVTFYPKVNVFVAAPATWDRMAEEQRAVVLAAAAEASSGATAGVGDEIEAAGAFCSAGHRVAFAPAEAVVELATGMGAVREWLERDPQVAADIRAIELLKASTPAGEFELPWQCRPRTGDWAPWPEAS